MMVVGHTMGIRTGPTFYNYHMGGLKCNHKGAFSEVLLGFLAALFFMNARQYCCVTHNFQSQIVTLRQLIHLFDKLFLEKKSTFCGCDYI